MKHLLLMAALHFVGANGQAVDVSDYSCATRVSVGEADAAKLRALFRENLGATVSIQIDGKTVASPRVRDVPTGTGFELTGIVPGC